MNTYLIKYNMTLCDTMVRDLFTQKIRVTPYLNTINTYDDTRFSTTHHERSWVIF